MLGGLLDGLDSPLDGLLGTVGDLYDSVTDVAEGLAPGSMDGLTLTGNLLNDSGVVGDLLSNVQDLDVTGAVSDVYNDVFAPGGAVNNLADGHGLGIEGLLGGVLNTAGGLGGILG